MQILPIFPLLPRGRPGEAAHGRGRAEHPRAAAGVLRGLHVVDGVPLRYGRERQTLEGSLSAVSRPIFAIERY